MLTEADTTRPTGSIRNVKLIYIIPNPVYLSQRNRATTILKKFKGQIRILFFCCCFLPVFTLAQSNYNEPQRNALTFNLGQFLVNEINLGYEHFLSENQSMELNGGLIYRNDVLRKMAEDWNNSQYFYERGFAARLAYKIYHHAGSKGRKNYYSFGFNYQYLYFNNEWFETDKEIKFRPEPGSAEITANEEIYRHRFRNRFGLQITLGNVYPLGKTFAIELYYGLGVRGIFSKRFDVARGATVDDEQLILQTLNFEDQKFYVRPSIHAGIKLRMGW